MCVSSKLTGAGLDLCPSQCVITPYSDLKTSWLICTFQISREILGSPSSPLYDSIV